MNQINMTLKNNILNLNYMNITLNNLNQIRSNINITNIHYLNNRLNVSNNILNQMNISIINSHMNIINNILNVTLSPHIHIFMNERRRSDPIISSNTSSIKYERVNGNVYLVITGNIQNVFMGLHVQCNYPLGNVWIRHNNKYLFDMRYMAIYGCNELIIDGDIKRLPQYQYNDRRLSLRVENNSLITCTSYPVYLINPLYPLDELVTCNKYETICCQRWNILSLCGRDNPLYLEFMVACSGYVDSCTHGEIIKMFFIYDYKCFIDSIYCVIQGDDVKCNYGIPNIKWSSDDMVIIEIKYKGLTYEKIIYRQERIFNYYLIFNVTLGLLIILKVIFRRYRHILLFVFLMLSLFSHIGIMLSLCYIVSCMSRLYLILPLIYFLIIGNMRAELIFFIASCAFIIFLICIRSRRSLLSLVNVMMFIIMIFSVIFQLIVGIGGLYAFKVALILDVFISF